MTKEAQDLARMARDAYRDHLADVAIAMKQGEAVARRLHERTEKDKTL